MRVGQQAAAAGYAGLHLVQDQQQAVLVAELAQSTQKAGAGVYNARLAVHSQRRRAGGSSLGLDNDGA